MRASDIVNQMASELPKYVDYFTTQVDIDSITQSSGTATATTSADHGLSVGQQVNITGALTPISCSITRDGTTGTLVTDSAHDITENAGYDVQIDGCDQDTFNGTFTLLSVPNRKTITFEMEDSGDETATGDPILLNGSNIYKSYGGLVEITAVPTTTTFEYEVDDSLYSPASGTIIGKTNPRISAAVDIDRVIQAYTKHGTDEAWAFVVLGDSVANKSRTIMVDAVANIQKAHYYNQKLIQAVNVYVFVPTSGELAARQARDLCEELLSPICQSILTVKFPSLVENDNNPLMITGHGMAYYNGAFYVHQYGFETLLQLGESDVCQPADSVAFRDINLTTSFDFGTGEIETAIDLDDEPLDE
jgi:hypothetical protein